MRFSDMKTLKDGKMIASPVIEFELEEIDEVDVGLDRESDVGEDRDDDDDREKSPEEIFEDELAEIENLKHQDAIRTGRDACLQGLDILTKDDFKQVAEKKGVVVR